MHGVAGIAPMKEDLAPPEAPAARGREDPTPLVLGEALEQVPPHERAPTERKDAATGPSMTIGRCTSADVSRRRSVAPTSGSPLLSAAHVGRIKA
jgi:hypothetical protein